jgi:hypothetical protein
MKSYGEQFKSALSCQTREEAEQWMENEVCDYVEIFQMSPEEAIKIIKTNLGYMAGYYSSDTAEKIKDLFSADHPGYGAFTKIIEAAKGAK